MRPSYQDEPQAGPANLVVLADQPQSHEALLQRLGRGYLLDFPAGDVRVEDGGFTLRAAALAVTGGKPDGAHPMVELRGSFRRLLGALDGIGDDDASFSFHCTVTTPSLLIRGMEIA